MKESRTILSGLEWGTAELSKAGKPSPRLDAELLLAHLLGIERLKIYLDFERPMGETEARAYMALVRRRTAGEPVAYITGKKEFYSREFTVTPDVLIPRPETESVVEAAIRTDHVVDVLDLGCGSGCIGITMAAEVPSANVACADISPAAIAIARKNAAAFGIESRVGFFTGDLFAPVAGRMFDAIVSNPPYIPTKMIDELQIEIRKYEPRAALDGGPDGLDVVRRIVAEAPAHLIEGGTLLVEIAEFQADAVREFAAANGSYADVRIGNDLSGRPRCFAATKGSKVR
ncbi:MAG: peptide chain release factor N(5)-glutamine methyltransferase [Deltaproteobacteria bacterium]|nr:peptide chain release factor N(5)-glutamine methyltransferase [Deltaproteobacteria bacterium]